MRRFQGHLLCQRLHGLIDSLLIHINRFILQEIFLLGLDVPEIDELHRSLLDLLLIELAFGHGLDFVPLDCPEELRLMLLLLLLAEQLKLQVVAHQGFVDIHQIYLLPNVHVARWEAQVDLLVRANVFI